MTKSTLITWARHTKLAFYIAGQQHLLQMWSEQRYEITLELKDLWDEFIKTSDFERGRQSHILLELFKYIANNYETSITMLNVLEVF